MNAMRAVIVAAGGDYGQWRGLVRPLIKVGFRTAQNTEQITRQGRNPRLLSWIMRVALGVFGLLTGFFTLSQTTPFHACLIALSVTGLAVFFLLLMNFQAVAVSSVDYEVMGHRPVNSRTYLVARLTVTLAHQGLVGALLALPSVLVCGVRFGWLAAAGLALAAALLVASIVLGLIGVYGALVSKVGGRGLYRLLTGLQLLLAVAFFSFGFLSGGSGSFLEGVADLAPEGWVLAVPLVGFAGFASLISGQTGPAEWIGLFGVLACCCATAWLARDKLSLASAQNLGAALKTRERKDAGRSKRAGLAAARPRLGVAGALIRGQFRHDLRFRMGVLTLLPLFAFYAVPPLLWLRGPADPFVSGARPWSLLGIHLGLLLLPSIVFAQLYSSDSWRAGWIFFAGPVDRAALAADARRFITLLFFVPCLILAGAVFVWLFEEVWHGLVHAALLGGAGVLALQISQYARPQLPFTVPPNSRREGVFLFLISLGLGALGVLIVAFAPLVYASPQRMIVTFVALASILTGMERILPARLSRRLRWSEVGD